MEPGDWIAIVGIAAGSVTALGVLLITRHYDGAREVRSQRHQAYLELLKVLEEMPIYATEAFRSSDQEPLMATTRKRMTAALAEMEIVGSSEVNRLTNELIRAIETRDFSAEVSRLGGGDRNAPLFKEMDTVERATRNLIGTEIDALKDQIRKELTPKSARPRNWLIAGLAISLLIILAVIMLRPDTSAGPTCGELRELLKKPGGGELYERLRRTQMEDLGC